VTSNLNGRLKLTDLGTVQATKPEWIWEGYIPKGQPSLLTGDPGVGKTRLLVSLAVTHMTGGAWPDGQQASEGKVLWVDGENGEAELRCRFDAHGFSEWDRLRVASVVDVGGRWCPSPWTNSRPLLKRLSQLLSPPG